VIVMPRNITAEERQYLEAVMAISGQSPKLESIWTFMDLAWQECSCDSDCMVANQLKAFYRHPVWLLNGLFIEQHPDSLTHREKFAAEIISHQPQSVCDYGGGYGGLARMIASRSPATSVEIYDPHPHPSSLELSASLDNIRHVDHLSGPYDVMVATDVFEHVPDPLREVENTSRHLRPGGKYLIANCFYPVIKCHLPCTFHFRDSFSAILVEMNLHPVKSVVYGTLYEKASEVLVTPRVRRLEQRSRIRFAYRELHSTLMALFRQWRGGVRP